MQWRRHYPQAQAAGKTEGRKKTNEASRLCGNTTRGVPGNLTSGREMNLQAILGNFALILFVLTVGTGIIWFLDVFYLAKQRRAKADAALAEFDARNARLSADGVKVDANGRAALASDIMKQPTWIEYSGSFFPVIALVFFLRSFLYEQFKIPSSSMVPTLQNNKQNHKKKNTNGVRLPIINKKFIEMNNPQRGDVMV